MAKPKHRDTVFTVMRTIDMQVGPKHVKIQPAIIGAYFSLERAEEIAGKYHQEMVDRGIPGFNFEVFATSYYDE